MKNQFNYFWWDGGFESVHHRPDPGLNPLGIAHVLTPCYRFDISRFLAAPCGLEINCGKEDEFKYGSVIPEPAVRIASSVAVEIDGNVYSLDPEPDNNRCIMVYDSGTVCHHLRIKNITLSDKGGAQLPGMELEAAFWFWNDLISFSLHLLDTESRLPVKAHYIKINMCMDCDGGMLRAENDDLFIRERNGELYIFPVTGTKASVKGNSIKAEAAGSVLCLHILPAKHPDSVSAYKAYCAGQISLEAFSLSSGGLLAAWNDPVAGGIIIQLPDFENLERERIRITAKTDCSLQVPVRMIVSKEGTPQIKEDGTIVPQSPQEGFQPMGSYPVAFNHDGFPSGSLWQVSIDGHEFENYPRPYTHKWLHLYSQNICTGNRPYEEILEIGFSNFNGRPAAQFCQLSLLGWDDNPNYGNPIDKTAVQLWHQGLINHQEVLCMCPESHMTDSTITDIRPVDQRNYWGPNNGGGDFLRYRLPGNSYFSKMRAARCHFPNYGPNVGTVEYYMTSEDDCIVGNIKSHIVAANDLGRVFFEAEYRVVKDCEVEEMTLIFLGCPGYDKSRYSRFAWGKQSVVMQDGLVEIQKGPGYEIIEDPLVGGEWFAAYRGGIIDEQYREPNGNKGLVYRGGILKLSNHPEAVIKSKRLRIDAFDGLTTQFWLGVHANTDRIALKKGDSIKVTWEYVPVLKYATDYGLQSDHSTVYKNILEKFPDSCEMIRYEATHGTWAVESIKGMVVEDAIFPTIKPIQGEAVIQITGGSGCMPLRIVLEGKPGRVRLEKLEKANWRAVQEVNGNRIYQLEKTNDGYLATFLVDAGAEATKNGKVIGQYRISIING